MPSATEICNLALGDLAVGVEIADKDTERSAEAAACRRFYDQAVAETFRAFPWPFATQTVTLALVSTSPTSAEWQYAYRYPADCLTLRRIQSSARTDTVQTKARYRIQRDATGLLIVTDTSPAVAEYTALVSDTAEYPPDFVRALHYLLASYLAPRVTAGDQFGLGKQAFGLYRDAIAQAMAMAANEEQPDTPPQSEFERMRD